MAKRIPYILLPILILANMVILSRTFATPQSRIRILEGGDGALLVEAGGRPVLIGAGSDAGILRALGTTLSPWERHLDALILTSPGTENAGGAPDVLARYRVGELIRPSAQGPRTLEAALQKASAQTHVTYARAGERFILAPGVYADVLWPAQTPTVMEPDNGSLALRLTCGSHSLFITDGLKGRAEEYVASLMRPSDMRVSSSTSPQKLLCSQK